MKYIIGFVTIDDHQIEIVADSEEAALDTLEKMTPREAVSLAATSGNYFISEMEILGTGGATSE